MAPVAAGLVVRLGPYPGALAVRDDLTCWFAYVRDAIVEPAIGKDILALTDLRRPGLLRHVFAICATSPGQIVSLQKIQGQLQDRGALETIAHYLHLLEEAYLIVALQNFARRPARCRAAPPKLVTLNNALLAAMDPREIPDCEREPERHGSWVENACLSHARNRGQHITYWRERSLEVDGVVTGDWGNWAIEVKTGNFGAGDLRGLAEFTRLNPEYRPLVLCDAHQVAVTQRLGLTAMPWSEFLVRGPAA